ncbi:MAG TPA: hypothetical protein VNA89_07450 [Gemmatimonadaceae bacterium]|nr:hypothetical protein [Gemmatimonadaceae bacterium]
MRRQALAPALAVLAACQSAPQSGGQAGAPPAAAHAPDLLTPDRRVSEGYVRQVTNHGAEMYQIGTPTATAWTALPSVLAHFDVAVDTLHPASRTAGNISLRVRRSLGKTRLSRILDCGSTAGIMRADTYTIDLSVVTQLRPANDGGTLVFTQVEGTGRAEGTGSIRIRCGSTGYLERAIAEALTKSK